ncbi:MULTISPECIES: hypothetical protein [Herbaspirillum]|jgi:hypothetical protein|uniref:Uncharacterized protein n=2 Tax=Herbaspirillum huttiense TaxID=863372 RepID=A0AAJ2HAA8_9BURK|nr:MULTISPECIES: hypothetical protein [Herbaspirillum]MDR9836816.1 hypothetical protein [Herbaspirillum huttiense]
MFTVPEVFSYRSPSAEEVDVGSRFLLQQLAQEMDFPLGSFRLESHPVFGAILHGPNCQVSIGRKGEVSWVVVCCLIFGGDEARTSRVRTFPVLDLRRNIGLLEFLLVFHLTIEDGKRRPATQGQSEEISFPLARSGQRWLEEPMSVIAT